MEPDHAAPEHEPAQPTLAPERVLGLGAPTAHARVLALQRTAGNQAVTRWLAREGTATAPAGSGAAPAAAPPALPRVDFVFLMGDETSDVFYKNAHTFFKGAFPKATIVLDVRSLSGIMKTIGAQANPIGKLVIVSHAHESGSLQFKIDENDPDNRLDFSELKKANADSTLPTVDAKKVDASTEIIIRGCNIGRSKRMLNELDTAFGGAAKVSAPTHEQGYGPDTSAGAGGATAPFTEKMSGYFVEEPGVPKTPRSDAALQPLFEAQYPFVEKKEWPKLLKQKKTISDRHPYELEATLPADKGPEAIAAFKATLDKLFPPGEGWTAKYHRPLEVREQAHLQLPDEPDQQRHAREGRPADRPGRADAGRARGDGPGRPLAARGLQLHEDLEQGRGTGAGVKVFSIHAERSEWIVKHVPIKDKGKEIDPAPGSDKKWWGESDATPP